MSEIEAAVRAAVDQLAAAWNANDYASVADCFDRDDPMPVYQAEEEAQAAVGWSALDDYFARTGKLNERIAVRYSGLAIKPLADDQALAFWQLKWTIKLATYARPLGGHCRVFALVRRRTQGWRFHHYVEAPLSPISYVRSLYEATAQADLLT